MGSSKRTQSNLTVKLLESLELRETVSESLGYDAGTLEAQRSKKGLRFCFRHGKPQRRINLPDFTELGQPTKINELSAVMEKVHRLSRYYWNLNRVRGGDFTRPAVIALPSESQHQGINISHHH